jgi:uracil-DNA glycosylase family 4
MELELGLGLGEQRNAPKRVPSFDELCYRVGACTLCERMKGSQRVLNRSAGPLTAPVMFIGEAPGRLGADGSGIPFHGDKAGHNFESLLQAVGIERDAVFVTNAVLCNPKDSYGNNSTPDKSEISNCANFLREQIKIVNPAVVVTLGMTALKATDLVEPHGLNLRDHVRTAHKWDARLLIPLYHPGQRAMIHRNFFNQRSDYQFVAETLRRLGKVKKHPSGDTAAATQNILRQMFTISPVMSYFSLHKLVYLIEYFATKRLGSRLTRAYFVRQKDGPYCTELHAYKLKKCMPELIFKNRGGKLFLDGSALAPSLFGAMATSAEFSLISEVMARYSSMKDAELKSAVYLTSPMRRLLRMERNSGVNTYNAPIEFAADAKF